MLDMALITSNYHMGLWVAAEICLAVFLIDIVLMYFEAGNMALFVSLFVFGLMMSYGVELYPNESAMIDLIGLIAVTTLVVTLYGYTYKEVEHRLISYELWKCVVFPEYHVNGSMRY